jgi:hypothetical protein
MQAVDTARPLHCWMRQQRGAIVSQIQRELHLQWILKLGGLEEHTQQRGSREVCDAESLADEIRAALPGLLDAVERR